MIHCDLAGKSGVPEDVLTSNCLGFLALLGGADVLNFLRSATNLRHELLPVTNDREAEATVKFWRYLPGGGIPDAIIYVTKPEQFTVVVEVKHGAPKSGSGETDQLARYWHAAERLYHEKCALVYLTHHRSLPECEIKKSLDEAGGGAKIFWLSWYDLFRWVAKARRAPPRSPVERRILGGLYEYLDAKGYRVFLGWRCGMTEFAFTPYRHHYVTTITPMTSWSYSRTYGRTLINFASGFYNPLRME